MLQSEWITGWRCGEKGLESGREEVRKTLRMSEVVWERQSILSPLGYVGLRVGMGIDTILLIPGQFTIQFISPIL